MRIRISNDRLNLEELLSSLTDKFSGRYSCYFFEMGLEPSIIVKKSTWVGAQITPRNKEIEVDFTFPTVLIALIGGICFYAGIFAVPSLIDSWHDLERELTGFLNKRYAN